jgi:Na+/proline symporter
MSLLDYLVLIGSMAAIAGYGMWRARGRHTLSDYLRNDQKVGWGTIGLSVMATQASAVTFLSVPGQAYESGVAFIQNYFGLPLAMIVICVVFLPIYRRLKIFTAYEYLGKRFDSKTRLLGAALFLLQRGLAAGITIYAPAIILSTVLGWRQDLTIICTGLFVLAYTVSGGNRAVNVSQRLQMLLILGSLVVAFFMVLMKLPDGLGLGGALSLAGSFGKMEAVDLSLNLDTRYTLWSGVLGGFFLSLSYFGTDQSQVGRYISGTSLRESRLGLLFNALFKIPMQFFVLLLGALVFVFYQFERPPVFFNTAAWEANTHIEAGDDGARLRELSAAFDQANVEKQASIETWMAARAGNDAQLQAAAEADMTAAYARSEALRAQTKTALVTADPRVQTNDADYIFISFILEHMPHGIIGLLIALIFAGAVSSLASELTALGSTTTVDFYRHVLRPHAGDAHYVGASRFFTLLWGGIAIGFALFANLVENLIQAINILGSIFYGVILGLFLVAFFLKRVGGTAVFVGGLIAQVLVIVLYFSLSISFLWFNLIGCVACILFSLLLQGMLGNDNRPQQQATET